MDEHVLFNPDGPVRNSFRSQELVPGRLLNQILPDRHLIDEGSSQKLTEDFNLGRKREHESMVAAGSPRIQTRLERVRGTDLRCEIGIGVRKVGLHDVAYLTPELVDLFHGLNSSTIRMVSTTANDVPNRPSASQSSRRRTSLLHRHTRKPQLQKAVEERHLCRFLTRSVSVHPALRIS